VPPGHLLRSKDQVREMTDGGVGAPRGGRGIPGEVVLIVDDDLAGSLEV
jgi:hypothetical protein